MVGMGAVCTSAVTTLATKFTKTRKEIGGRLVLSGAIDAYVRNRHSIRSPIIKAGFTSR